MKHPVKIGVTGGIGSGKSTICKVIEILGYPVYYSDARANHITASDPATIAAITEGFGPEAYEDGVYNRRKIAEIVFSQPEKRDLINSIVHPAVRKDFEEWCARQESPLVFQESALLFETGNYRYFDKSILVVSPLELRVKRIASRDNISEEAVRARIASQMPDEEKRRLADFVIENDEKTLSITRLEKIIADIS